MKRRTFLGFFGSSVVCASVSGCVGTEADTGNSDPMPSTPVPRSEQTPDREVEDRVRFRDLQWGSHCVPSPCMWSLRAGAENLSGESFVAGYVLTVQTDDGPREYTGAVRIEAWGEAEVVIRTDIPDTELQPTDFELIPVKVEQPVTPTPVPDPESYARVVDHRLEPDSLTPTIHGVVENVSEEELSRVVIRGTFYVGDEASEASNVSERDLGPGEQRSFSIDYFRGFEGGRIDGYEVEVVEVYL